MDKRIHLGWILGIGLSFMPSAEAIQPSQPNPGDGCGQNIAMRDVLVLDVESRRRDPELAQEYVDKHAGDFRLLKSDIEEIITRSRPSKDPGAIVRGAKKLGAKNGCDLVVVLKTGPYFGRQRGPNARMKDHGYAWVVMGQRLADH